MIQPITKSSLTAAEIRLLKTFQLHPFCRVEGLHVRDGQPSFSPAPTIIQRLKMGANNNSRPELELEDFLLKKQTVELLEIIAELGNGQIRSIEVQFGLPLLIEVERRPVSEGDRRS